MKIKSLIVAASLALVPATSAFAIDKEAIKKAKEEAKQKAIEDAKQKAAAKAEAQAEKAEVKAVEKKAAAKADAAAKEEAAMAAAEEERKLHARHTGLIERLEQIAAATTNAELTAIVGRLKEKEAKRHALAAPAAPAK